MNQVYTVRLKLDPQDLVKAYCDCQDIEIANHDVKNILEEELKSWLYPMDIEIEKIEEVSS